MAYNPFDFFRTNQKILFSVMTVIIMFVFVLSIGGGRGDFFNWFPDMLRSQRSTGEVVAAIDGSDVKESKVADLRRTRGYANQFMVNAQAKAGENLGRFVAENLKKVSPDNQRLFDQALNAENQAMMQLQPLIQQARNNPRFMQFIQEQFDQARQSANDAIRRLEASPNLKPDDAEMLTAVKKLRQLRATASADRQFFTEMPNKTTRDALEFMLWLKKADALGIRFRDEDVDAMVTQEFLQFPAEQREKVLAEMLSEQRQRTISRQKLYEALANEFRVRAAMTALLGPTDLRGAEAMTPFGMYEFFRNETSYARYGVISFPVDNFLDQVKGEPSEQEIKRIFDQARNTEPNPADPRPGLKEPRRLKLEFIEATGKEPFYVAAGADALLKTELNAKLADLLAVPFGPSTAGLFVAPSILALPEPALQASYNRYKDAQFSALRNRIDPNPLRPAPGIPVDSSVVNLKTILAVTGLGAGPLTSAGSMLSTAAGLYGTAEAIEYTGRLNYGFTLFAPPLFDGVAGLADVSTAWALQGMGVPQTLPLATVKPMLAKEMNELMRYNVCETDLQKFFDEWAEIAAGKDGADKEKAAKDAREYVAKFTGTQPWKDKDGKEQMGRGLKVAGSTEFHDLFSIVNDPGLAPLVKLWKPTDSKQYRDPATFAAAIFLDPTTGRATTGLNQPMTFPPGGRDVPKPTETQPTYIVWRSAEQPAEAPKVIDDKVRAKVVAIWKRQKAREKAREAADALVKKFDGKLGSNFIEISQRLTSARAAFANETFPTPQLREKVRQFEIPDAEDKAARGVGAAIVSEQPSPTGGLGYGLRSFQLAPTEQMPYVTQKIATELVANRNKPLSTAFSFTDASEANEYVAVLEDRSEESPSRFNGIVYNPDPQKPNQVSRAVADQFQATARQNDRALAVEMLKAEFGYEKENPELDKKFGDSSS